MRLVGNPTLESNAGHVGAFRCAATPQAANHVLTTSFKLFVRTLTSLVAPSIRFSPSPEIWLTLPGLQRIRGWAGQAPGQT